MATQVLRRSMRIIGMPYQFTDRVDPRINSVSKDIGRKFAENILLEAPVLTVIPGEPDYLPASSDKVTAAQYLTSKVTGMTVFDHKALGDELGDGDAAFRYYDFKPNFTDCMSYINILCRAMASFLELDVRVDGATLQQYDWRAYNDPERHQDLKLISNIKNSFYSYMYETEASKKKRTEAEASSAAESASSSDSNSSNSNSSSSSSSDTKKKETKKEDVKPVYKKTKNLKLDDYSMIYQTTANVSQKKNSDGTYTTKYKEDEEETFNDIFSGYGYLQFFVDGDVGAAESFNNETAQSMMEGMFESSSGLFKELGFLLNSGGIAADEIGDEMTGFVETAFASLNEELGKGGTFSGILTRLVGTGTSIVKGQNFIIPEIYQKSSRGQGGWQITAHLKNHYGTKLGYAWNIGFPMMHYVGISCPKQMTANTYGSPFLVKCHMDGVFTCNLGIITDLSINKNAAPEAWTVDGLPNEVDITLTIKDLYSDLSLSPQQNPSLFANNASLVDFIAINCGMSLATPNTEAKVNMLINTFRGYVGDFRNNAVSAAVEGMNNFMKKIFPQAHW